MRIALIAALLAASPLSDAWAWGQEGHSIVAEIAQRRLDEPTLRKVKSLLGGEASLASIASWADDHRADNPKSGPWHYVSIPYDKPAYDAVRDCRGGDCVVEAVGRFRKELSECAGKPAERAEALKFVVHFVGDIHQPLHATERTDPFTRQGDVGGNKAEVTFFGKKMNLHEVWDFGLIQRTVHAWGSYVDRLESRWFPGRDLAGLDGGEPADWANEAHRFGVEVSHDFPDDGTLGIRYFTKSSPAVDRQLAVAGLRLARLLKDALASCP